MEGSEIFHVVTTLKELNYLMEDCLQALMLNDRVQSISRLQSVLVKAEDYLSKIPSDTPCSEFEYVYVLSLSPPFINIYKYKSCSRELIMRGRSLQENILLQFLKFSGFTYYLHADYKEWVLKEVGVIQQNEYWR